MEIPFSDFPDIGHMEYMMIALVLLLMAQFLRLKLLAYASLALVVFDFFTVPDGPQLSNILHYCIDLVYITGLALVSSLVNKKYFRLFLLPVFLLCFLLGHDYYAQKLTKHNSVSYDEQAEILVMFNSRENLEQWMTKNNTRYDIIFPIFSPISDRSYLDEFLAIDVPDDRSPQKVMQQLESDPDIPYAEFNEQLSLHPPGDVENALNVNTVTNDPMSDNQWSVSRLGKEYYQLLDEKSGNLKLNDALLAILDTGIDANHEDLKDNYRSISRKSDNDKRGHGTHCAGIAAAVTGNGIGIASILPASTSAKITSVKVINDLGLASQSDVIRGIINAVDNGASVISLSLGGISNKAKERAYTEAISYARDQNVIVLASAGNSSANSANYSPANVKGIIAVGSFDSEQKKSRFSNYLSDIEMGIYAPGENILSTFPDNTYKTMSGTSMSAPFVAGLALLFKSYDPSLDVHTFYEIIHDTAIRSEEGYLFINPIEAVKLFFKRYPV